MGLQVKLLVVSFVLLFTLSFCQAKKATVTVVGILHSKDSIKNQSTNSNSTLGIDVFIICNERTQANGGIDKHGKFNVTLSAEIGEDGNEIDGCYAKLQSNSGGPCHIQEPQAASVNILSNGENENGAVIIDNNATVIKFSPLNCQSAFFWPFPNLTFFGSPPSPPDYTAPPSLPESTAPAPSPDLPPLPPLPQPSYDPPAPAFPPPEVEAPSPPPTAVKIPPSPPPQAPPPLPVYSNPSPTLRAPPSPAYNKPLPSPSPPSATIPRRRRPSPIPKAPPIPRLPLTPSVPRKYFNPPRSSKSKPPHLV